MENFQLFIEGIGVIFQIEIFLILVFGVVLGIIGGALPGFSSTNTTALMLPLTFVISPEAALVLIAGIYCGAMYGDAIPAILFGIPGSPGAGATMIDGYPLAEQGKADMALGLSIGASVVGGILASIITIIFMPLMATYALKFGPAELFLLTMISIVIVSTISGTGPGRRKGLVAGLLGMLIASITADPAYAQPRLWLGFYELYDEIPLVSAMIGIFAIPSIIQFVFKERVIDVENGEFTKVGSFSRQLEGVKEVFKRPIATIRATIIGFLIGAVPGTGATIATYVSYGQAKMWSKNPESYGKGNYDGVIASEAANNAVSSGALIPTLTLGIPGSGTTAMMLIVLIIHGIVPGPNLIRDSSGPVYALLAAGMIAPIIMLPVALLLNRFSAKLTILKSAYLVPFLFILSLIGTFAVRAYIIDIYLALMFGLLGILMTRFGYPVIPFVLGIILGPIAERNLFRVIRLSDGSMNIFLSNVGILLLVILFIVVFSAYIMPFIKKNKKREI